MKTLNAILAAGAVMAFTHMIPASAAQTFYPGDRITGDHYAGRSPIQAVNGATASAQPLASMVGIDILKAGGNAVDAAIAMNAVLGLMEPVGNGIGGDIFVLVYDPETQQVYGLNGAGRSPMGLDIETVRANLTPEGTIPPVGPLPVSVPGAVDGWFALHERFGRLPMEQVLAPAIRYAEEGFPVSQTIAYYWERNMRILQARYDAGAFNEFDNARATYLNAQGRAPAEGEVFRNPDLARTYRLLAEQGRDAYYEGEIARTIDAYMRRIGGWLRYEDFAAHTSEWVEPVTVNYRGYDVWQIPPQGQGMSVLQMLQILEGYDLASMGFMSADTLHVMIEAKRLAFEDRARFYADPAYQPAPVEWLLSDEYAAERRALISMERAMDQVGPGDPPQIEHNDTTYLTTADSSGMMVSLIQSNYRGMGAGIVADGLGFMFQNRGEAFSLDEGHPNVYEPGKRPFHTIIPGMVTYEGQGYLSFGVMGGAMQPQGHVQVLSNMIDFGLNIQQAGDAARWRHEGSTEPTDGLGAPAGMGVVHLESGVPQAVRDALEQRGHVLGNSDGGFGGYQAIRRDPVTGVLSAASEMRTDGAAQGY
ncbi:gamma-glutamyltransferase [Glycocaulis sp.]|uniref:gamma-glutamyltransferase n=1 Tax=Glycocaulis sp. TaxID=1969725 RepID=UPI003F71A9D6